MKRRAVRDNSMLPDELGQDSFLDTMSNLVGVLIILVVVVGAHASKINSANQSVAKFEASLSAKEQATDKAIQIQQSFQLDNAELERQIQEEERLGNLRAMERAQILVMLQEMENELESLDSSRSEAERAALQQAAEADQLKHRIEEARAAAQALDQQLSATEAIDHFPTPIAKTVFRDDVHFRLKGGRIAFVPLDELVQRMRGEWKAKAEKLGQTSRIVETVGPIDGFRMQYTLTRRQVAQRTSAGPVTQQIIEFDHFSVLPPSDSVGEVADAALLNGSTFTAQIAQLQPDKHTISVWVYPDSYREFNQIKRWLYERGFQTATWPLSADGLISGGPKGQRTAAQ
jgi:hypothetical protein